MVLTQRSMAEKVVAGQLPIPPFHTGPVRFCDIESRFQITMFISDLIVGTSTHLIRNAPSHIFLLCHCLHGFIVSGLHSSAFSFVSPKVRNKPFLISMTFGISEMNRG